MELTLPRVSLTGMGAFSTMLSQKTRRKPEHTHRQQATQNVVKNQQRTSDGDVLRRPFH